MVILENIDIDIDKAILQNIDIDKISNRFKFGISNRAIDPNIDFLDTQTIYICFDAVLFGFLFNISELQLYDQSMNSRKDLLR